MNENEQKVDYEKIADSIISYLEFIKKFKEIKKDDIITNKQNNNSNSKFIYTFRNFNIECYIIEKKVFDNFKEKVNFKEITLILDPINDDNKKKFIKALKEYLEKNPYLPNGNNINIFSKEEEMKEIVQNFNNYSFINKELLIYGMGVPESKLKDNIIKASKNENNTSLLSVLNNFIITIKSEKNNEIIKNNPNEVKEEDKNKINKNLIVEYKNLYYVEELTKKIFTLLYFNEKKMEKKIQKGIKDLYNFRNCYLINRDWLKQYKEFFLYEQIKKKLDKEFEGQNYSYKKVKNELNDIVYNKIGQIRLFNETKIDNWIRDAKNLKSKKGIITIKNQNKENLDYEQDTLEPEEMEIDYNIPISFEIINEDIYKLLIKEDFLFNINDNITEQLSYKILFGNNQIIIRSKLDKNKEDADAFSKLNKYLIYSYDKELKNNYNNDKYILKYILNYNKENYFFNDFKKIVKEGIKKYIEDKNIDININNYEENIIDDKKKNLGKFINIKISENDINNNFDYKDDNKTIVKYDEIKINNIEKKKSINVKVGNKFDNIQIDNNENITINNSNYNLDKNDYNKNYEKDIINKADTIPETKDIDSECDNTNKTTKQENNNLESKKNKEYSIEQLKGRIDLIIPYFSELFIKLSKTKTNSDLEIKTFLYDEIIEKIDNQKFLEIILINEESSKEIISFLKYNIIKEYINSEENIKCEILQKYKKEFCDIFKLLKNKNNISKELSIIKDYNECILNIKEKKKFLILNKKQFKDIDKKTKNIYIYYFIYKSEAYIFFKEEKKYLKIEKDNDSEKNDLYLLKEDEIDILNYLQLIESQINKNKKIEYINQYKNSKNNSLKEFYLINNKWYNLKINYEKKKRTNDGTDFQLPPNIKPETSEISELENKIHYPIGFVFIEKQNYEIIINDLVNKDQNINIEDIVISKILFTDWQKDTQNLNLINYSYIGLFNNNINNNNNNYILFYMFNSNNWNFEFLLQFIDENIMNEEIKIIKQKGIGKYLYEMGIDLTNDEKNLLFN